MAYALRTCANGRMPYAPTLNIWNRESVRKPIHDYNLIKQI